MKQPGAVLTPGDKFPDFALPDAAGVTRRFYNEVTGRPAVLLVVSALSDPEQAAALASVLAAAAAIAEAGGELFVIGAEPAPAIAKRVGDAALAFFDVQRAILPDLLAPMPAVLPEVEPFRPKHCTYVLDPNQRVLTVIRRVAPGNHGVQALAAVRAWGAVPVARQVLRQSAPVLILPDVLEPALCERLITLWREGGHQEGSVSDGRQNVYAPDTKKNLEHLIKDPELSQHISLTLARRIGPELAKVFNYGEAFRFEGHIVLSYEDHRQDFFGLHRDNLRVDSPRRFAASTNLNDGYEGGELVFPEYGPHGFRPPAGGTCIFSCNLLHEARPVTRGQRFVMTSFFCAADKPLAQFPADRRRQMQV